MKTEEGNGRKRGIAEKTADSGGPQSGEAGRKKKQAKKTEGSAMIQMKTGKDGVLEAMR